MTRDPRGHLDRPAPAPRGANPNFARMVAGLVVAGVSVLIAQEMPAFGLVVFACLVGAGISAVKYSVTQVCPACRYLAVRAATVCQGCHQTLPGR